MGKRQPFACPVPGCTKRGKISSLMQHFHDSHTAITIENARLRHLIESGGLLTMDHQNPIALTQAENGGRFWLGLLVGFFVGAFVMGLSASLLSCYDKASFCPPSIARLVRGG